MFSSGTGNDLWSFNTSSGNWTWKGGKLNATTLEPNYPDKIGGIGWPGSTMFSAYCKLSKSAFIFGSYGMENALLTPNFLTSGYGNELWQYDMTSEQFL